MLYCFVRIISRSRFRKGDSFFVLALVIKKVSPWTVFIYSSTVRQGWQVGDKSENEVIQQTRVVEELPLMHSVADVKH